MGKTVHLARCPTVAGTIHSFVSPVFVSHASLINWNATPEIDLGTALNSSFVPAGHCSENSIRHSRHFPISLFSQGDTEQILHYGPARLLPYNNLH